MMCSVFNKNIYYLKFLYTSINSFRYVRSNSKRINAIKTIRDVVIKNKTDVEDFDSNIDYKEIAKRIKENDLEIEETFFKGEDLETIVTESSKLYDINLQEEKSRKRFIKKQLIGRKYFNEGKETNLLTYAAKEQIRYLHNIDPMKWTPEILANSFPISVPGVKKLLKSSYVLTSPEKIKAHDEDVKLKWDVLLSGKTSNLISSYTQNLWKSGHLKKENYNGNPSLANISTKKPDKPTIIEKKKKVGEFASIVQKYVELKAQKEALKSSTFESSNISDVEKTTKENHHYIRKSSSGKNEGYFRNYNQSANDTELPFSQFKENLKDELKSKSRKSSMSKKYYEWIEEDSKENVVQNSKIFDGEFLTKIPKYKKETETQSNMFHNEKDYYMYDDKLGYQNPVGHIIHGKIKIPSKSSKKNSLYKKGKCVYDENGEFLYKLPT